jgi:hypothetical protein
MPPGFDTLAIKLNNFEKYKRTSDNNNNKKSRTPVPI